ncbi:carbon-nitrogen hydrolase family protein [Paracoccus sp. Z330]|uniref:Carbon-nitrogen hydrolase family protein n=1 Tax=Paracoccus onchidii TaxID=3017813 RepID=A0ABT4ZCM8_9RHOB|nr:carbon-nitrogen hydrolase family protein [Paracoccus onchidii]MDB6177111.1 carbon-nitrogen hydrolase family protein [Paracoccus onchidii]
MKIAAAAYPFDWFDDFSQYEAKIRHWVAAADGADLMVFPEYGAMELASLGGRDVAGDLQLSLSEVARHADRVAQLHCDLSREHDCVILAASGPHFAAERPVNRAALYASGQLLGVQDKHVMTRFEREDWDVIGGEGLRLIDTPVGRVGILICYDSEFPLLGRVLAEAGVEILLVPSCTDTVAGFHRVRIGAMARALEGQCLVVQAPTVGDCAWNPAIDENHGRAAIYGPPDGFWPEDGIVAQGDMDQPGWVMAEVDIARVAQSRRDGAVLPFAHWPETTSARIIQAHCVTEL